MRERITFLKLFQVPEIAHPYIHMFATDKEMGLVENMDGHEMTAAEMAARAGISVDEARDGLGLRADSLSE